MARIRTIKPDFWTDEKVVEISPCARLLFIGLWNFADDEGRVTYRPTKFKMQILPNDNVDISELLGEIRGKNMITVYEVEKCAYLQINNFAIHQKIDKRSNSKLPPPPDVLPEFPRIPTTEGIKEGIKDQGREGIKDHNAAENFQLVSSPPPIDRKKGTRFALDDIPEEWFQFCRKERPDLNPQEVFIEFRDYWISVPASRGLKLDWFATWRNRVRAKHTTAGGQNGRKSKTQHLIEGANAAFAAKLKGLDR